MNPKLHTLFECWDPLAEKSGGDQYDLGLLISPAGVTFTYLDVEKNAFLSCCSIEFTGKNVQELTNLSPYFGATIQPELLNKVLEIYPMLRNPFHQVRILVETPKQTLMPEGLFIPEEKEQYLHFTQHLGKKEVVLTDKLRNAAAYNIYAISPELQDWILVNFPSAAVFHSTTAWIQGIMLNCKSRTQPNQLYLNFRRGAFDLLSINGGKLMFGNAFPFRAREDVVYYVMFVIEQLGLSPGETVPVLCGEIGDHNDIQDLISRYVFKVTYLERSGLFQYSHALDEIQPHRFFTLFNLPLCG